jgi:hypothetical protein
MTNHQHKAALVNSNRRRNWRARAVALAACGALVLAFSACSTKPNGPPKVDIVTQIPWTAPETHTYELRNNNKPIGETTLSIARAGDSFVFTQHTADTDGNSDEALTTVDATTLKPAANKRTVTDSSEKRVADATYEDTDKDCSAKRVVKITQLTFKPPDESEPESTRSNPLCVPEHAYDNDESLFLWRTIKFEKGYTATYNAIFSNRRDTQVVTLKVTGQDKITTPAGEFEVWVVELTADEATQTAWFATTDDHKLVAYQNESFFFRLEK